MVPDEAGAELWPVGLGQRVPLVAQRHPRLGLLLHVLIGNLIDNIIA